MAERKTSLERFTGLKVMSFPFRIGNLLLLVLISGVFTYLYSIWNTMGISGFVLTSMLTYFISLIYISYLVYVAEYTSLGYQYLPALSVDVIDASRWKVFKVLVLFSFFASLIPVYDDETWRTAVAVFCVVTLPIATAVLLLDNSLVSAITPTRWLSILTNVHVDGGVLQLIAAELLFIAAVLATAIGNAGAIGIFFVVLFSMIMSRSLGVVLHDNADRLGIHVLYGSQVDAARQARMRREEISREVSTLEELARDRSVTSAFRQLETRLTKDHFLTEAELFDAIRNWESPELAILAGRGYIERLIQRRDYKSAFEVLLFCFNANGGTYMLYKTKSLLKLVEHIETVEQRQMIATMLVELPDRLPRDPAAGEALVTAARLLAEDLCFEAASKVLKRVELEYPLYAQGEAYERIKGLVRQEPDG